MTRPQQFPIKFEMAITKEMETAIAAWRRLQPDQPDRPEAIRRLINLGIANAHEFAFKQRTEQP